MRSSHSAIFLLALAACEEVSSPEVRASNDVIAMSRDAVAETPSVPEAVVVPTPTPARDDGVLLGTAMLTDPAPIEPALPMATFTLRHGETLDHFARWSGYPVEDIAAFSGLSLDGEYAVGTTIQLPLDDSGAAGLDLARAEHWSRRLDGYLASRGGAVGTEFYEVRTGDSAWSIARSEYAIPMWVLELYNPSVNLDRLRPGQDLMVPVLADVVVDAQSEIPEIVAPETSSSEPVQAEHGTQE